MLQQCLLHFTQVNACLVKILIGVTLMLENSLKTLFHHVQVGACNLIIQANNNVLLFKGVVVRIWVKEGSEEATPCLITTWGIYFTGLDYIGTQLPKEVSIFEQNTVIFSMSWGYFTAKTSLNTEPVNPEPRVQEAPTGKSYNLATMCRYRILQQL